MELRSLVTPILDLLYPRCCAACGAGVGPFGHSLCWDCRSRLQWITPPFCHCCGDPLEGMVGSGTLCAFCRRSLPAFDCARSLLRYTGPCKPLIQALKYGRACWLAGELADWLGEGVNLHFPVDRLDAVIAVPLSGRRRRERTYNQAQLLADGLARRLRIPCFDGLQRRQYGVSQTRLDMAARRRNVRGAFTVKFPEWIAGRRILVVDDVMTTGATLGECARMLKQADAVAVYAVSVARG